MIFPLCLFIVLLTMEDLVQANTLVDDQDSMMERMKVLEVKDAIELNEKSTRRHFSRMPTARFSTAS